MHQIQFLLRPSPCWGSLQSYPDPLAAYKGREGKEEGGGKGKEREACPQLGSVGTPVEEEGQEKKAKEGSFSWGVQALLF